MNKPSPSIQYWYPAAFEIVTAEYNKLAYSRTEPLTECSPETTLKALIELYNQYPIFNHADLIERGLVDLQSDAHYEQIYKILKHPTAPTLSMTKQRALAMTIHDWAMRTKKEFDLAAIYARCISIDLDTLITPYSSRQYYTQWNLLFKYHDCAPHEAVGMAAHLTRYMFTSAQSQNITPRFMKKMAGSMRSLDQLSPDAAVDLSNQLKMNLTVCLTMHRLRHHFPTEYQCFNGTPLANMFALTPVAGQEPLIAYPSQALWAVVDF